jgi:hypothetical protein
MYWTKKTGIPRSTLAAQTGGRVPPRRDLDRVLAGQRRRQLVVVLERVDRRPQVKPVGLFAERDVVAALAQAVEVLEDVAVTAVEPVSSVT